MLSKYNKSTFAEIQNILKYLSNFTSEFKKTNKKYFLNLNPALEDSRH